MYYVGLWYMSLDRSLGLRHRITIRLVTNEEGKPLTFIQGIKAQDFVTASNKCKSITTGAYMVLETMNMFAEED